ncbi:MAG: hypothetical protein WCR54_07120 [Clostridia bacterium]
MNTTTHNQPLSKDLKLSPNQLSDTQVKPTEPVKSKTLYRCSNCGVIHECDGDTPPRSCLKCDNNKFYKVKR